MVIVDWFTKFVFLHPLAQSTSKAIIKFIEENFILICGEFQKLLSDCKVQKIWYNVRYHPQVNHTENKQGDCYCLKKLRP